MTRCVVKDYLKKRQKIPIRNDYKTLQLHQCITLMFTVWMAKRVGNSPPGYFFFFFIAPSIPHATFVLYDINQVVGIQRQRHFD